MGAELDRLRAEAMGCTRCHLYKAATQTVFGQGPQRARMVMVGEQPGDREDLAGEPFVGPAGRLLDRAMEDAGINRGAVYVTNAVKHFKFKLDERGKRRIHERPGRVEIEACRPWLMAELEAVQPRLVVCLGAVAGRALFGSSFKLTELRGTLLELPAEVSAVAGGARALATTHPSAILRSRDRDVAYKAMVEDLRAAAHAA